MRRVVLWFSVFVALSCDRSVEPPGAAPPGASILLDARPRALVAFVPGADGVLRAPSRGFDVEATPEALSLVLRGAAASRISFSTRDAGPPLRGDDGTLRRDLADGAVERVEVTDGALEQSWEIERPTTHDWVVRVDVEGADFLTATATGLHFRADGSDVGLRYSHGTVLDASGNETDVEATWAGDHVELRVPGPGSLERAIRSFSIRPSPPRLASTIRS